MRQYFKSGFAAGRDEQGQIAILTAFVIVIVMGFAALAIDLGFFAETKRDLQNDADAMALAGVQELAQRGLTSTARQANATETAGDWADLNDVDDAEIVSITYGTTCSGASKPDTITVRLQKTQSTYLASVIGIGSGTLNVCATARTGMAKGGPGLLPIGLLYTNPSVPGGICYYDAGTGNAHSNFYYDPDDGANLAYAPGGDDEKCVIKITNPTASDAWASGNTGPLRLDTTSGADPDNLDPDCQGQNTGGDEYGDNIEEGSECAYGKGDEVKPLTGNQGGNTCSSFTTRHTNYAHTGHNIGDVFMDPVEVSNQWIYRRVDESNPHFGIIPVITTQGSGSSIDVEIIRFVTVFVVGCEATGSGANQKFTVTIIPVNSQYFVAGQEIVDPGSSGYTSDWPAYTIKLIE